MKGSLHTDELMGAVVAREGGIRTERRISHCFIMDVPGHPEPLIITDAAVNIAPTSTTRSTSSRTPSISRMRWALPEVRVAILSAMETVNAEGAVHDRGRGAYARWRSAGRSPARCSTGRSRSTTRSARRRRRSRRSSPPSRAAPTCSSFRISRPATCSPRACRFLAGADAAGIVLGARVPIILTSRADSLLTPPRVLRGRGHGRGGAAQGGGSVDSVRRPSMNDEQSAPGAGGQKALVVGIANDSSIAYGCAKAFRCRGADLAVSWLNEKARPLCRTARPRTRSLDHGAARRFQVPGQLEAMFEQIAKQWGRLDILVHSIAFAPKDDLQGGLLNCSAEGFAKAMDISCHSFVRMAKLAAPLMTDGGAMFAMSYYGANRVVPNYNVMGPVKAALEAACRYLAYELGPQGIRVHAISPGPLKTRAASGLKDFELLLNEAAHKAPLGELVDIMDVGYACAYLATPFARRMTGGLVYVDGGANLIA